MGDKLKLNMRFVYFKSLVFSRDSCFPMFVVDVIYFKFIFQRFWFVYSGFDFVRSLCTEHDFLEKTKMEI